MKVLLSDRQIEFLIENIRVALNQNKVPEKYHENLLLTIKSNIHHSGKIENVCYKCLGTGRNI
jgi:hypothetical protein